MTRDDRLLDARDVGLDAADAAALVDGTASWHYAAGIFATRVAQVIANEPRTDPGEPQTPRRVADLCGSPAAPDRLIRRYLWRETTALGRLHIAYTQTAGIIGKDVRVWRDILEPAIQDALGQLGPTRPTTRAQELGLPEYFQERKDAALAKLMPPQNRRPQDVAAEEGITKDTAYRWRREAKAGRASAAGDNGGDPKRWSSQVKFQAVLETASMNAHDRGEYCVPIR